MHDEVDLELERFKVTKKRNTLCIALLLGVLLTGLGYVMPVFAQTIFRPFQLSVSLPSETVDSDYPGANPIGSDGVIDYELYWVKAGLCTYYQLKGRWPDKWEDVVKEGIFLSDLVTVEGHIIDPDDSKMDYFGDVYYTPLGDGEVDARFTYVYDMDGMQIKQFVLEPPTTFADQYTWMAENGQLTRNNEKAKKYISALVQDPQRMKQIALATMLYKGIRLYNVIHGQPPATWNEYINSGLAPIKGDSINPVTGELFRGDGSAGDFLYKCYSPGEIGNENPAIYFTHIDLDGNKPLVRMSYF